MKHKFGDFYHYSGAIHIHTTASDGTKTLNEVIKIGQSASLDFMMFSDHMTLHHRVDRGEGVFDKMLVVVGYEHNDEADRNHYLLFDSPQVYDEKMKASQYVTAGAADNALGILAHPDEIRDHMKEYPPYPWDDWNAVGYNGIEIWNQMSEWTEKLTRFNKLAMSLSPRKSMVGPTDRILKKWDELNQTQKIAGVAGVDAHAFPIKIGPLKIEIFPYKVHFRCLRTHIILREPLATDFQTAKAQLYTAIKECRLFNSNMRWGVADSFKFYISSGDKNYSSGDSVLLQDDLMLSVKLPSKATIKLVHNGKYILSTISDELSYTDLSRGLYRVEVWKGNRGWIFSNHIRVGMDTND